MDVVTTSSKNYEPSPSPLRHTLILHLNAALKNINLRTLSLEMIVFLGILGSVLLTIGSFGAGDRPTIGNPQTYFSLFNFLRRMPVSSAALVYTGAGIISFSWLLLVRLRSDSFHYSVQEISSFPPRMATTYRLVNSYSFYIGLLCIWTVPRLFTYPLFSQDIYSYFAQGEMLREHFNPYTLGPGDSLGVQNIFTSSVPKIWWYSPSPYGPVFLAIAQIIVSIVHTKFIWGLIIYRFLAVIAILTIAIAGKSIARKINTDPTIFIIFGVLNPVVLFSGLDSLHNDVWAIALAICGINVYLSVKKHIISTSDMVEGSRNSPCSILKTFSQYTGAIVLIVIAALIKIPVLIIAIFICIDMMVTLKLHRARWKNIPRILILGFISIYSLGVTALCSYAAGYFTQLGFGWLQALHQGNVFHRVIECVARIIDVLGIALHFGNHYGTLNTLLSYVPLLLTSVVLLYFSLLTNKGSISFIRAAGFSLLFCSFVLVVTWHPWYNLWWVPLLSFKWPNKPVVYAMLIANFQVLTFSPGGHGLTKMILIYTFTVSYSIVVLLSVMVVRYLSRKAREFT